MTDNDREPNVLDAESLESDSTKVVSAKEGIESSKDMNATPEEAVWEQQAKQSRDPDHDEMYDNRDQNPLDEEEEEQEKPRKNKVQSSVKTISGLLLEEVPRLAGEASGNLRTELTGTILFVIEAAKTQTYLFTWKGESVEVAKSSLKEKDNVDCVLRISEESFFQIAKGDLNPQVAMLSEKIHVTGKLSLAVYFFNLFTEAYL